MLDEIARDVLAGKRFEQSWELFRVQHFPGRPMKKAISELEKWCKASGLEYTFTERKIDALGKTYVIAVLLLTPS